MSVDESKCHFMCVKAMLNPGKDLNRNDSSRNPMEVNKGKELGIYGNKLFIK